MGYALQTTKWWSKWRQWRATSSCWHKWRTWRRYRTRVSGKIDDVDRRLTTSRPLLNARLRRSISGTRRTLSCLGIPLMNTWMPPARCDDYGFILVYLSLPILWGVFFLTCVRVVLSQLWWVWVYLGLPMKGELFTPVFTHYCLLFISLYSFRCFTIIHWLLLLIVHSSVQFFIYIHVLTLLLDTDVYFVILLTQDSFVRPYHHFLFHVFINKGFLVYFHDAY